MLRGELIIRCGQNRCVVNAKRVCGASERKSLTFTKSIGQRTICAKPLRAGRRSSHCKRKARYGGSEFPTPAWKRCKNYSRLLLLRRFSLLIRLFAERFKTRSCPGAKTTRG